MQEIRQMGFDVLDDIAALDSFFRRDRKRQLPQATEQEIARHVNRLGRDYQRLRTELREVGGQRVFDFQQRGLTLGDDAARSHLSLSLLHAGIILRALRAFTDGMTDLPLWAEIDAAAVLKQRAIIADWWTALPRIDVAKTRVKIEAECHAMAESRDPL